MNLAHFCIADHYTVNLLKNLLPYATVEFGSVFTMVQSHKKGTAVTPAPDKISLKNIHVGKLFLRIYVLLQSNSEEEGLLLCVRVSKLI